MRLAHCVVLIYVLQVIAATNRIDILDPALLRSGRLDRKIEFPLPGETARARILEIHSRKMSIGPDVNFEELARSTDEFNGAQLKAVCVEAGMIALREGATKLGHEHFISGIAEGELCPVLEVRLTGLTPSQIQYKARRRMTSCTLLNRPLDYPGYPPPHTHTYCTPANVYGFISWPIQSDKSLRRLCTRKSSSAG